MDNMVWLGCLDTDRHDSFDIMWGHWFLKTKKNQEPGIVAWFGLLVSKHIIQEIVFTQ